MSYLSPGVPITVVLDGATVHAHIDHVFRSLSSLWFRWYALPQPPQAGECNAETENITWCHGHVTGTEATALLAASALAHVTAD